MVGDGPGKAAGPSGGKGGGGRFGPSGEEGVLALLGFSLFLSLLDFWVGFWIGILE